MQHRVLAEQGIARTRKPMDIVAKASAFAADKHSKQRRKYVDQPYFNHLAAVARTLEAAGIDDPTVIAAAYLHDTVEDTDATVQDVIRDFGADVAELVYWLTDSDQGNRESRTLMSSWRLARAPIQAKLIKFADIIDNATSIREHDPGFFKVFAAEKMLVLTRMLEVEGGNLAGHALFKRAWTSVTP
jgi:(p)ppGpp synthase/HD superfamily hydrolase